MREMYYSYMRRVFLKDFVKASEMKDPFYVGNKGNKKFHDITERMSKTQKNFT